MRHAEFRDSLGWKPQPTMVKDSPKREASLARNMTSFKKRWGRNPGTYNVFRFFAATQSFDWELFIKTKGSEF